MTPLEIFVALLKLFGQVALMSLTLGFTIVVTLIRFVLFMMKGMEKKEEAPPVTPLVTKPMTMEVPESGFVGGSEGGPIQAFGIDISKEGNGYKMSMPEKPGTPTESPDMDSPATAPPELPQGKDGLQK